MPMFEDLWLEGLHQGRTMRFRGRGGSMAPFLRDGDIVTIEPGGKPVLGQVVLTGPGDSLILHRVVAKRNGWISTKGDALGRLDAPVTREQILGRAVARERGGRERRLDTFWRRWLGLAFSLTVPLVPGLIPCWPG